MQLLSNVGGTATLIGDPPNIIIGSAYEEIGFVDFIIKVYKAGVNPRFPDGAQHALCNVCRRVGVAGF